MDHSGHVPFEVIFFYSISLYFIPPHSGPLFFCRPKAQGEVSLPFT